MQENHGRNSYNWNLHPVVGIMIFLVFISLFLGVAVLEQSVIKAVTVSANVQSQTNNFNIWRTIDLGGFKSVSNLTENVVAEGTKISKYSMFLLGSPEFSISTNKVKVDLVRLSVASLGFTNGAGLVEISTKAKNLGLALCPAEAGPALCLFYDQPKGDFVMIAMNTILGCDGHPEFFFLSNDDSGKWLNTNRLRTNDVLNPENELIFIKPRK
jgi:hypothetical protein